jgi:cytochrome b subunit of formate dehydrogenase
MSTQAVSKQTQKNWWIDATLFISAVIAALSGIYFLFLPTGGFQGGRNPLYNVQILFTRQTWDDLHAWGGVVMIAAAVIHLVIHWKWVTSMTRRTWNELTGKCGCLNPRGRGNLILNTVVAISFLLTAISGMYFLFITGGRWAADPMILFTRTTWDLIHTWAGISLIAAVIIHLAIHRKWVTKVTRKMLGMTVPAPTVSEPSVSH